MKSAEFLCALGLESLEVFIIKEDKSAKEGAAYYLYGIYMVT